MQDLLELQTLEFGAGVGKEASARIAALRERIHPQVLAHYDRFRVRGKKGLVPVVNQVCSGCHMRLPLGVVMTLKHDQGIQLCDTCGRYLYLPEAIQGTVDGKSPTAKPARALRRRKKAEISEDSVVVSGTVSSPPAVQPRINPG